MERYQQGDVILEKIEALPSGAEKIGMKPVMEGEGHHEHVLCPEKPKEAEMYEREGVLYFRLSAPAPLKHIQKGGGKGEHGTQVIEPGLYKVGQVYEHDWWTAEARKVID